VERGGEEKGKEKKKNCAFSKKGVGGTAPWLRGKERGGEILLRSGANCLGEIWLAGERGGLWLHSKEKAVFLPGESNDVEKRGGSVNIGSYRCGNLRGQGGRRSEKGGSLYKFLSEKKKGKGEDYLR